MTFRPLVYVLIATGLSALAADRIKQNNTTALNLAGSWDTLPGASDVGVWDATVTGANATSIGGNISWLGLRLANPGGLVTVGTTAEANVLTLGSSGIDMSTATQNLLINGSLTAGANQTWAVPGGRTLQLQSVNTNRRLEGSGDIVLANSSGTGTATFDFRPGASGSTLFTDQNGFFGFSGDWTIGSGVEVRTLRNGQNAWGSGGITLAGGRVGQHQNFNGAWTNPITLRSATTSTLDDFSTGSARWLKLQGVISGSGNVVFDAATAFTDSDRSYILTGNNSMSGTVTINSGARLRVGGIGGNENTTGGGTSGNLGTATVVNNGNLTFGRTDAHTVNNTISGPAGANIRVGGALITGTGTQILTYTGNASGYQGLFAVNVGTFHLSGGTLGSATPNGVGVLGIGDTSTYRQTSLTAVTKAATVNVGNGAGGLLLVEDGVLRTNAIDLRAGSAFSWASGRLTILNTASGSGGVVNRLEPGSSASAPPVYEGTALNVTGAAAGVTTSSGSILDLGYTYPSGGMRYDQLKVSGAVNLSSASDSLYFSFLPYFFRPSVFGADAAATLTLVDATSLTGTFDTFAGVVPDQYGFAAAPGSGSTVATSTLNPLTDIPVNTYYLEYETSSGNLLFHYRVSSSVPEPGTLGLAVLGAWVLRVVGRRRFN